MSAAPSQHPYQLFIASHGGFLPAFVNALDEEQAREIYCACSGVHLHSIDIRSPTAYEREGWIFALERALLNFDNLGPAAIPLNQLLLD